MEKKYTIQEVAELLQIDVDTIRLYEKEDLVAPMRDSKYGTFYYNFSQIHRIMGINLYQQIDVGYDEIRHLLSLSSFKEVSGEYAAYISETERQIAHLQQRVEKLRFMHDHLDTLARGIDSCEIRDMPEFYLMYGHPASTVSYLQLKEVFHSPLFSFGNFCYSLKKGEGGYYDIDAIQLSVRTPMFDICPWKVDRSAFPVVKSRPSIYTVAHAPISDDATGWDMEGVLSFASKAGVKCLPDAYAFYVYSLQQGGDINDFYELYVPIEG